MKNHRLAILVLLCVLILMAFVSAAQCKVIYVSTNGSDTNDGLSWSAAKKTVTAGVSASVTDDEI